MASNHDGVMTFIGKDFIERIKVISHLRLKNNNLFSIDYILVSLKFASV